MITMTSVDRDDRAYILAMAYWYNAFYDGKLTQRDAWSMSKCRRRCS